MYYFLCLIFILSLLFFLFRNLYIYILLIYNILSGISLKTSNHSPNFLINYLYFIIILSGFIILSYIQLLLINRMGYTEIHSSFLFFFFHSFPLQYIFSISIPPFSSTYFVACLLWFLFIYLSIFLIIPQWFSLPMCSMKIFSCSLLILHPASICSSLSFHHFSSMSFSPHHFKFFLRSHPMFHFTFFTRWHFFAFIFFLSFSFLFNHPQIFKVLFKFLFPNNIFYLAFISFHFPFRIIFPVFFSRGH